MLSSESPQPERPNNGCKPFAVELGAYASVHIVVQAGLAVGGRYVADRMGLDIPNWLEISWPNAPAIFLGLQAARHARKRYQGDRER